MTRCWTPWSSTAVCLLASIAVLKREQRFYVVFFDGEEAYGTWSKTDGIYGSRHLAARWDKDGTSRKIIQNWIPSFGM